MKTLGTTLESSAAVKCHTDSSQTDFRLPQPYAACAHLLQTLLITQGDFMLLEICCFFSKVCTSGHHCLMSNYPYLLPTTPSPIPPVICDRDQPQSPHPPQKANMSLFITLRSCHSPWGAGHSLSALWDSIQIPHPALSVRVMTCHYSHQLPQLWSLKCHSVRKSPEAGCEEHRYHFVSNKTWWSSLCQSGLQPLVVK